MNIPSNILHDKQYADQILEITADTMFFVYKDGTCLDFKANTADFSIKNRHKAQRKAKFYINKCRSASCMQGGLKQASA